MRLFANTIQRKLLLILLLAGFLPAVAGVVYLYIGSNVAIDEALGAFLQEKAEGAASPLDSRIEECYRAVQTLAAEARAGIPVDRLSAPSARKLDWILVCDGAGVVSGAAGTTEALSSVPPRIVAGTRLPDAVFIDEFRDSTGLPQIVFSSQVTTSPLTILVCGTPSANVAALSSNRLSRADGAIRIFSNRGHFIDDPARLGGLFNIARHNYIELREKISGWLRIQEERQPESLVGFSASRFLRMRQKEGFTSVDWIAMVEMNKQEFVLLAEFLLWRYFGFGLVLALSLVALSVLAARRFLRPIRLLHANVERLAQGDLSARVTVRTHDEIEELANAVNEMAARIGNFAAELEEKVRERTSDLEAAHEKLLRSERYAATGRLAGNIAHEINNPLGIVKNYLRIYRDSARNLTADQEEALLIIQEELDRIARIVRSLLDFYRPSRAQLLDVDLNEEIESLLALFRAGAAKKGIVLDLSLADGLPLLKVAPDHIRQVLLNIIKNAEDSMPAGGRLGIRTSLDQAGGRGQLVLQVSDTGVGISAEDLPHVFEPFFTRKEDGQGTGLGLAVTYGIVQNFGGTIEIASEPGSGTTVTVRLPVSAV